MRVLIADDHALFRDGLRSLLEAQGLEVVGETGDGFEAVVMALELHPDIVLMDLSMPGMGGLEAIRRLAERAPDVRTLVLTASDEDSDLFEAIRAGARGYLLKDLDSSHFFPLLEQMARDEPVFTPAIAHKVLDEFARATRSSRHQPRNPSTLTRRERDLLKLMVRGITTNRDLAYHLGVRENTVKFHMRNILDKLHLHSRAEVVAYALRHEIVDAPPDDPPTQP